MKRKKRLREKSNRIWENCLTIKYFRASFLSKRTQQCETERSGFSCEEILWFFPPLLFQFSQSLLESNPTDIRGKLYNNSFVCLLLNVRSHYHVLSQSSLPLFSKDLKESWPYHRVNNALWAAYLLSVRKKAQFVLLPWLAGNHCTTQSLRELLQWYHFILHSKKRKTKQEMG